MQPAGCRRIRRSRRRRAPGGRPRAAPRSAPSATTSLATNAASIAAWRGARPSPDGRSRRRSRPRRSRSASIGDAGRLERRLVSVQPLAGGRVRQRRIRDAGDAAMAEGDQVFDRVARAGDVVDVDAGDGDTRQRPLEDDREAVANELEQAGSSMRGPETTRPSACCARSRRGRTSPPDRRASVARPSPGSRPSGPPTRGPRSVSARIGVAGDLLGRLAQDEGDDVARAAGQLAGRRVGVVAELARRHRGRAAGSTRGS